MALRSTLWKLISAGKQLTLINTEFVSVDNYFMTLLAAVESTSLQMQFVAIRSLRNQLLPNGGMAAGCCEGYQQRLRGALWLCPAHIKRKGIRSVRVVWPKGNLFPTVGWRQEKSYAILLWKCILSWSGPCKQKGAFLLPLSKYLWSIATKAEGCFGEAPNWTWAASTMALWPAVWIRDGLKWTHGSIWPSVYSPW